MVKDGNCTYGEHLVTYIIDQTPSCSLKTNVILYTNYISINKTPRKKHEMMRQKPAVFIPVIS